VADLSRREIQQLVASRSRIPRMLRVMAHLRKMMARPDGPSFVYELTKSIDMHRGEGTYHVLNQRVMKFYHYEQSQVVYEPLEQFADLRTIDWCNNRLAEGGAPESTFNNVVIGIRAFRSIYTAPLGVLPLPKPGEDEVGDHSVRMMGLEPESDYVCFSNSWGPEWGNEGYGYLSEEYFDRFAISAWLMRVVPCGLHPATVQSLRESSSSEVFANLWQMRIPSKRFRLRHRRRRLEWSIYESVSVRGHPITMIDIRTGYGLRIGWAHVHHLLGPNATTCVVKELFVWPAFRSQGIGTLLERMCVKVASRWGAEDVEMLLHEADDLVPVKSPGRAFAVKCGYLLSPANATRPAITAVAVKHMRSS
jgi:GNAT superfamily N-acetyltransferase